MTTSAHCRLWVEYWTVEAARWRREHNVERHMFAETQRAIALRCERCGV